MKTTRFLHLLDATAYSSPTTLYTLFKQKPRKYIRLVNQFTLAKRFGHFDGFKLIKCFSQ